MTIDFKSLKKTSAGMMAPILLIGPVAQGKERNFADMLSKSNAELKSEFYVDLNHANPIVDENGVNNSSKNIDVLQKIEAKALEDGAVVAIFPCVETYFPALLRDLVDRINSNQNDNIVFILGCENPSEIESGTLALMTKMNVIKYEGIVLPPVSQVEEIPGSVLHEYRNMANDLMLLDSNKLVLRSTGIGLRDTGADLSQTETRLASLKSFVETLGEIDGGMLGQEAHDRGMDDSVVKALAAFSRAFYNSDNETASHISKSVISQLREFSAVPRFVESSLDKHLIELDNPSL